MVELFAVGDFVRTPSLVIDPVPPLAGRKLPTPVEVERT